MKGRIAYLSLSANRQGNAYYAHVNEIINGLRRRQWQVELFTPAYQQTGSLPGYLGRMPKFLETQMNLWKDSSQIDALYIRFHFAAFPTVFWAKLQNIPVVQEINGHYTELFVNWPWTSRFASLVAWLMRSQLSWADAVITVTPQLKTWLIQEFGSKTVHVISNGANTDIFAPQAKSDVLLPKPYVVFFGAFAPWQGIDTMLYAVEQSDWPANVNLVFVGDGIERPKVEKAVENNPKVMYLGMKSYQEIAGIVAGSIGGLSPQNKKGDYSKTGLLPLKVYETLACGVPIVVSDFPGQADLVRQHQCGLVIPPEDPAALAHAVAFLYNNPSERQEMGNRGNKVIEQDHSWDKRAASTETVIQSIIDQQ
jgi:glycosyltransferase involved in cell wall biosynthesis